MSEVNYKTENVLQSLKQDIINGILPPGKRLASERRLCEQFNVSRNTLRGALQKLQDIGVVFKQPGCSVYIDKNAPEIIENLKISPALKVGFIITTAQSSNPILEKMFESFRRRLDPEIEIIIFFHEIINFSICEKKNLDIIVIFGDYDDEQLQKLQNRFKHIFLLNQKTDTYNYISPNHYAGGRMMAEYMASMEHKNTGCLVFDFPENSDYNERLRGIRDVYRAKGFTLTETAIPSGHDPFSGINYSNFIDHLFKKNPAISGIFCICDFIALELYEAFNKKGIRIPEDISIIGFDDQYYSQYLDPPLTTIKYPAEAVGAKLAESVNNLKNNTGKRLIQEEITSVLFKRKSLSKFKSSITKV